jgi:SAM-dependent methyltransferase
VSDTSSTTSTAEASTVETTTESGPSAAEELSERIFGACLGWVDTMAVYLGLRLGWYRSLADDGPATASELAQRTGTQARYAREWLEQQAVSGILGVVSDATDADPDARRFALLEGTAEVFTDERSLFYLAPLTRMFAASGAQLEPLLEAYRDGGGVTWEQFGEDARESQADVNRPWFDDLPNRFGAVEPLDAVLSKPDVRIADVGTGAGWSTIALAQAYPGLRAHGFDVDAPSVETARRNAASAGVADRVSFHLAEGEMLVDGAFDAAFAFECIHDMPRPVEVLAAMRRAVRPGGMVVVMDEAVADEFAAPGDDLERIMYGFSLFICLPDGLSHEPSVGTGTVMRRSILQRYAREAGFREVEVLPIEEFGFWRFYRLIA